MNNKTLTMTRKFYEQFVKMFAFIPTKLPEGPLSHPSPPSPPLPSSPPLGYAVIFAKIQIKTLKMSYKLP